MAGRLQRDRRGVAIVVSATVVQVASSVAAPLLIGRAVDVIVTGLVGRSLPAGSVADTVGRLRAQGRGDLADVVSGLRDLHPGQGVDFPRLAGLLTVLIAMYVVAAGVGWIQGRMTAQVVQRAANGLRHDVETKLARLPMRYFDTVGRGEIVARVTNDVDNVTTGLQQSLSQMLTAVVTVFAVVTMMIVVSPLLSVTALVFVPVSILLTRVVGRRARSGFIAQWKGVGALTAHVEEVYSGHQVVAMSGQSDAMAERFAKHNDAVFRAGLRAQFASGTLGPLTTLASSLNYVAVAVVGGLRVASGALSLGDVQAMLSYTRQAGQMVAQGTSTATLLQSALASAQRVFELLDEAEIDADTDTDTAEADDPGAVVAGRVSLEHVSFGYEPGRPVLHEIDLDVAAGSTTAVVGPTGAGKSTLTALILRLYDVDSGRVLFDGVDVRTMSRSRLRSRFAVVPQDVWLFHGTIGDNIGYGARGARADSAAVRAAAEAACLDHVVRTLPAGYDTVISPDHPVLSVGEQQLVTIARAFMADPAVLLLDEATSAVDARTEALVQQATERLSAGRTTIVVAHRLRTIERADLIVYVDGGTVCERGTHQELLAADGMYSELYRSQYRRSSAADGGS